MMTFKIVFVKGLVFPQQKPFCAKCRILRFEDTLGGIMRKICLDVTDLCHEF